MQRCHVLFGVVALLASGCGPTGSGPSGPLTTTYSGVLAGSLPGESGTIDLVLTKQTTPTAEVSLTGNLVIGSTNGAVTLSGTVDTSRGYAAFSGSAPGQIGTLTCSAGVDAARIAGVCTGADSYFRSFTAGVRGTGPVFRYCGTASGNGLSNLVWNVFSSGRVAGGAYGNGAVHGIVTGTLTGNDLSMAQTSPASATGQVSGSDVSGTWTITYLDGSRPPDTGTFSSSVGNCP